MPDQPKVPGFNVPTRLTVGDLHAEPTAAGYHHRQAPYDAFWGVGQRTRRDTT
jgi:hypothetical protein